MKWGALGGLVLLLAVALSVQAWREAQRPDAPPPVHTRYKVGHRWYYKTRPHEPESTLVICKVETDARHGVLVHIGLEGLRLDTPKGKLESLAHLPMTAAAMDASVTRLAAVYQPLPKWLDAYERWKRGYDGGRWPPITGTVADGINFTEESMQRTRR
jgi:hypothetical protein